MVGFTLAATAVWAILFKYVLEPLRLKRIMEKQGVEGPPYRFLFGNILELIAHQKSQPVLPLDDDHYSLCPGILPHHTLYAPKYGKRFLVWWGPIPRLVVQDPELAKEVLSTKFGFFAKPAIDVSILTELLGHGLPVMEGEQWAINRRTLNPLFHMKVLKGMIEAMVKGAAPGVQKWEHIVAKAGGSMEIDVEPGINTIAGNILTHTAFGIDDDKGRQVSELQKELLPTRINRRMAQTRSKIRNILLEVLRVRREALHKGERSTYGNDFLGRMLAAASEDMDETAVGFNLASALNNCKVFYLGGQDSVSVLLSFTLFLLARHPEWQDRARKEVLEVVGDPEAFDSNVLSRLKIVTMVFNESLRLFPVAAFAGRVATKAAQISDPFIPKGMVVEVATQAMNYDPDIWGVDADTFNPERFANGISKACTPPQAFMPFSTGPRFCIGKDLAMLEAKIVLCMFLRRFQFSPPPNYNHYPSQTTVQTPKYGMQLMVKALDSPTNF